nr:12248_t:CDS:2 [Entrophospora candida]
MSTHVISKQNFLLSIDLDIVREGQNEQNKLQNIGSPVKLYFHHWVTTPVQSISLEHLRKDKDQHQQLVITICESKNVLFIHFIAPVNSTGVTNVVHKVPTNLV